MTSLPPSLYLHVPFCVRRCLYCDFYVLPLGDGPPARRLREFRSLKHRRFLQALDAELAALPGGFKPRTVYIGGGTPTEMGVGELSKLFSSLKQHVDFSQVEEFSCEANPGTLDKEMAALLVSEGVNRISLGVQSFNDRMLQALGRIHNAREAHEAVELLRDAGVENLSLDLLFGLPDTAAADLQHNLQAIRTLSPEHVSWYSLEYEAGTAFTEMRDQGFIREASEEETAAEYLGIREGLAQLGYTQYELFSFSSPGFACRHNINYWQGGDYYGVGPSAHSHIRGRRWSNLPDLSAYILRHTEGQGDGVCDGEILPPEAKARELLMTHLRLLDGVDPVRFETQTGFTPASLLGKSLQVWQDAGWVQAEPHRLRLMPEAYLISDSLFREFI